MTNGAGCRVQSRILARMRVYKSDCMARGHQLHRFRVAKLAAIRRIHLCMTDQAIRHLRHGGSAHPVGFLQPAMTSLAGARPAQMRTNIAGRREILPGIDGGLQHRRDIPEFQMQRVVESIQWRSRRGGNGSILMALEADLFLRQQIVTDARALRGRRVAVRALQLQFQMNAMRKRRALGQRRTGQHSHQEESVHYGPLPAVAAR